MKISASIVIYNDDPNIFEKAINSFINACDGILVLIDNSDSNIESLYFNNPRVLYFKTGKNIGFGAAHNLALKKINFQSDLHFIINPDIVFDGVINEISLIFEQNESYGALMPKIIYPDGSNQNLCKLLPTPIDLFLRRFLNNNILITLLSPYYVLTDLDDTYNTDVPSLSGCFLAIRTNILREINGFDERFFLYMEDVDLIRRIGERHKTIYCPSQTVTHAYKKGSYINKKLLFLHIRSGISYFNKYGWFFDFYRTKKNKQILFSLKAGQRL